MDASGSKHSNKSYYDVFSSEYERIRGPNAPGGYHELLDELESGLVARYGTGKDVLEVGCGTGLVLTRLAGFAKRAVGVDLSPGMLEKARARGLEVQEASATELPFPDASFDVTCSFKVLPHIPDIGTALSEMARVTRPGGHVLAEFYNPNSFRGLIKRFGPKLRVGENTDEGNVYIRFDSPRDAEALTPSGCRLIDSRGVRITIAFGQMMQVPGLNRVLRSVETQLCDSPLKRFGGFWIAVYEKDS
jgi:ubiquinone/menaquinone biosynthesis C-methylase UbiE